MTGRNFRYADPALRLQFSPRSGQFSSSFGTPPDLEWKKTKATRTVTISLYYPPKFKSGWDVKELKYHEIDFKCGGLRKFSKWNANDCDEVRGTNHLSSNNYGDKSSQNKAQVIMWTKYPKPQIIRVVFKYRLRNEFFCYYIAMSKFWCKSTCWGN